MPGGIKEAAKLLAGLDQGNREKVLEIIAKQDPSLADILKKNIIEFEDLKLLTPKMLQELIFEVGFIDMGLALRLATHELREHVLNNVAKLARQEILEHLNGGPQSVPKIQAAVERILEKVRKKMETGEIILDKSKNEKYV